MTDPNIASGEPGGPSHPPSRHPPSRPPSTPPPSTRPPSTRRRSSPARFGVAVVLTGVAAGLIGSLLVFLLHAVQRLAFGFSSGSFEDAVQGAPPGRRVLALVVAAVVTGLGWALLRRGRRAMPSVTEAMASPGSATSRLALAPTTADAVLQVIAVGAGASLGREGAPRQAAAAFADWLRVRLGLDEAAGRVLLACGAGAGLAAVYHVPLGGSLLALEVLLVSARPREVTAALVSAAVATTVAAFLIGDRPIYAPPALAAPTAGVLVFAVVLGPLAGIVGTLTSALSGWARANAPTGWRVPVSMALGFTLLGIVAVAVPQVLGNGSGPTQLALVGTLSLPTAALLLVLKPLATSLCLRVGAAGGMLTPSIATGAVLGMLAAHGWSHLWAIPPVDGVVIGSAAVLAVAQRAPLMALAMLAELTGSGAVLLTPMALAVALALVTAWRLRQRLSGRTTPRVDVPASPSG